MFCKKCGTQLGDNAKFCKVCGTKIGHVEATQSNITPREVQTPQKPVTPVGTKPAETVHKKKKPWIIAIVIFVVLVIAALCGFVVIKYFGQEEEPSMKDTKTSSSAVQTQNTDEATFSAVSASPSVTPATEAMESVLGMISNISIEEQGLSDVVSFSVSWDAIDEAHGYEVNAYIKPYQDSLDDEWENIYSGRVSEASLTIDTRRTSVYGIQVCIKAFKYNGEEYEYGIEGQSKISNEFTTAPDLNSEEENELSYQNEEENMEVVEDESSEYIFPNSDKEYLTKSDIKGMSFRQINLAKNELYARHGYTFKKGGDAAKYFKTKSWYHPTVSSKTFAKNGDAYYFNKYEIANRNLLVKRERKLKK